MFNLKDPSESSADPVRQTRCVIFLDCNWKDPSWIKCKSYLTRNTSECYSNITSCVEITTAQYHISSSRLRPGFRNNAVNYRLNVDKVLFGHGYIVGVIGPETDDYGAFTVFDRRFSRFADNLRSWLVFGGKDCALDVGNDDSSHNISIFSAEIGSQ